MLILGINDHHGASCCLLEDGRIVAAYEEERFTREKSCTGYPVKAIEALLRDHSISARDIEHVAVGTRYFSYILHATKLYPRFGVRDFLVEMDRYWRPHFLRRQRETTAEADVMGYIKPAPPRDDNYLEVMKEYDISHESFYPLKELRNPNDLQETQSMRRRSIARHLGVDESIIDFVDHHTCHAFHAYWSSPIRGDALILTADGFGDGTNATVNTVRDGQFKTLMRTAKCNIGRIYQLITLLLRMKPAEHEYKVMGLAAYAMEHVLREPYETFRETLYVDGLEFKYRIPVENHYDYFAERLRLYRFDAIAGALQRYTEELLVEWTRNAIKQTGLRRVVFSGGVSLNVKACKRMAELPEIEYLFVPFAGGDESIAIGAAQFKAYQEMQEPLVQMRPIQHAYIGPRFEKEEIHEALVEPFVCKHYEVIEGVSVDDVAKLLIDGKIIAVMFGRSEFGPRALGHRSIVADPRDPDTVTRINAAIKHRDFWMPFAPSILREREQDYLINPKKLDSPFMTLAFDTTPLAHAHLRAALHPADFTARAQIVNEEDAPQFYKLIRAFDKLTGVGGVLNTSLNFHGLPIVRSPIDAVREVLANRLVYLEYLLIESTLLRRKDVDGRKGDSGKGDQKDTGKSSTGPFC